MKTHLLADSAVPFSFTERFSVFLAHCFGFAGPLGLVSSQSRQSCLLWLETHSLTAQHQVTGKVSNYLRSTEPCLRAKEPDVPLRSRWRPKQI